MDSMDEVTGYSVLRQLKLLVGIISFLGLFSLDVWKAWKSKARWIPQGALVLSAFSLQLLDLLDYDIVSIGDYPETKISDAKILLKNQLVVDGGRVMVCVYMGYLLPEMARSPSKRVVWSDIGALAISVFTHIISELYVFCEVYWSLKEDKFSLNPLSIVSRVCTMLCAMFLFLCLGSAVFASKSLYNVVLEKIPIALGDEPAEGRYSQETVEKEVFQSWIVAWVCKPDYLIARSVLVSSVGMAVTLSVVSFAGEWITQDYQVLHFHDGVDWFRFTITAFMCLLILMGWSIICWRWMAAVIYFPGKYKIPHKGYFHVEDFWMRHIYETKDEIEFRRPPWDQHVSGGGFFGNVKHRLLRFLNIHHWLLPPLLKLQIMVILFSKLCFFFSEKILFVSEKILFVKKIRWLMFDHGDDDDGELLNLAEALEKLVMPGEDPTKLLVANSNSIKETKAFMEKGRREGKKSQKLIELMRKGSSEQNCAGRMCLKPLDASLSLPVEKDFDYLRKLSWKITALSLIQVIMKLDDRRTKDHLEAYSQAYEFFDLLDNPVGSMSHYQPELLADKQFTIITQQLHRPRRPSSPRPENYKIDEAVDKVRNLQRHAQGRISYDPHDSVDWWAFAVDNSLYNICTIILDNFSETSQYTEFVDSVERLLADVMMIMLEEEVGAALVKSCRDWAGTLEDEKIRASVYIAGKAGGLAKSLKQLD